MTNRQDQTGRHSPDRIADRIEFTAIFAGTFAVLLVGALVALLLPWTWSRRLAASENRWLIARAWRDANTITEFAFMG